MKFKQFRGLIVLAITLLFIAGCKPLSELRLFNIEDMNGNGRTQTSVKMENQSGAYKDDKVTLTIIPNTGYSFEKLTCTEGGLIWPDDFTKEEEVSDETKVVYSFIMPDSNVSFQVYYKEIPKATYNVNFDNYDTSKVTLRTDKTSYTKDETVTVTATSDFAYDVQLSISDTIDVTTVNENKKWTFKMPAEDVTVKTSISGYPYKISLADGNSTNGIKLSISNVPERAQRRNIYLGSGADKTKIDTKAEWSNPDHVKDSTYFYPFTKNGGTYTFTVTYEDYVDIIATDSITITAKGGIGSFECVNAEQIKITVDKKGNLKYVTKPNVIDDIVSEKQLVTVIQGWDATTDWVDAGTAWLTDEEGYYWLGKWDWKAAGNKVTYDDFNIIDWACTQYATEADKAKNINHIDSIINNKGIIVDLIYRIKLPGSDDDWYEAQIFDSQLWDKGPEGHGVFVLEASPLLGTWVGKSRAYTFNQNKVIVEDATSCKEYSYTYTADTVTFNGVTYDYTINEGRTKLTVTEDDDVSRTFTRSFYGDKLEAGNENAEIKIENNIIKFVKTPGHKTIPEGVKCYRVDFCTEGNDAEDYGFLCRADVESTTDFNDIYIDDYIWDKTLKNGVLKVHVLWGHNAEPYLMCETEVKNYKVAEGYELPEIRTDGSVVTMTKPGDKLLALYPETDHYTVFIHNEANKWSDWLGYKEFALTDDITFDLGDLDIDPADIKDGKVYLCLELKKADEGLARRLTDYPVPFSGSLILSDNTIGMNDGISFKISKVPAKAKIRDVKIIIDKLEYQIHWTDDPAEVAATTFTYPLVVANTEYTIRVNYYIKDETGKQSDRIAHSTFKTTPKGGDGSIIAVNAPDIEGKIEGQKFVWISKPTIRGTHTAGYFDVQFFNDKWDYIGSYYMLYSDLKENSFKGFDLADANWTDQGKLEIKNMSALNVIYKYDANDNSGYYDDLPSSVNQKTQEFKDLSINIDLSAED